MGGFLTKRGVNGAKMRNCLIRNLPEDLADQILNITGQAVLTKGIMKMLNEYMSLHEQVSVLQVRVKDLENDLSLARDIIADEIKLTERKTAFLKLDPDRYQLHGD